MSAYQANIIICPEREWHNQTLLSLYQIKLICAQKRYVKQGFFVPSGEQQITVSTFGRRITQRIDFWVSRVMEFFTSAVTTLQTVVCAIGAGVAVWGIINLLEGYGNDNPGAKSQGMKQLMAGGGIFVVGITLIPLLSGLF